jgi:hypothetical protein
VAIWYIFPSFGVLYQEKSCSPGWNPILLLWFWTSRTIHDKWYLNLPREGVCPVYTLAFIDVCFSKSNYFWSQSPTPRFLASSGRLTVSKLSEKSVQSNVMKKWSWEPILQTFTIYKRALLQKFIRVTIFGKNGFFHTKKCLNLIFAKNYIAVFWVKVPFFG